MLKDSLIELMTERDFKNISVKDITERADLNRGTFYNHYTDTYDLLQKMESDVLADFQDMIDNFLCSSKNGSLMPILLPVIQYIEENVKIARILFENSASSDFVYRFHQLISDNGTAIFKKQYPGIDDVSLSYFIEFITFGLTGVLRCWINNGMKESKEKIAEIADKSAMQVVQNLWGH
jgi:AcrR family transcriptional regulator